MTKLTLNFYHLLELKMAEKEQTLKPHGEDGKVVLKNWN